MPFSFPARSCFYDLRIVGIDLLLVVDPRTFTPLLGKNGGTGTARAKKMGIRLLQTIR